MSTSYRPNYKASRLWREAQRNEVEAKLAEETARKKFELTDTNFPTLVGTARPLAAVGGTHFADLAQKWQADEEVNKKMEVYRQERAAKAAKDSADIMAFHHRRTYGEDYSDDDVQYSSGAGAPSVPVRNQPDSDGWVEVNRKARKIKRDLTIDEMDAREAEYEHSNEAAADDFNGELFESNRHDHDRV